MRGSAWEVFRVFLRLGVSSFGGPIAHLGYFRTEAVERRKWLDDREYADLVALCQFLPGPASSQVGFAIGMHRAGALGALAAFLAFTLPSAALMVAFAYGASLFTGPVAEGLLIGLKIVAVAIVAQAVLRIGRRALKSQAMVALAAASFVAIFFLDVPFPVIVLTAGAIGYAGGKAGLPQFRIGGGHGASGKADAGPYLLGGDELLREHASLGHTLRVLAVWAALWLLPVAVVLAIVGFAGAAGVGGGSCAGPWPHPRGAGRWGVPAPRAPAPLRDPPGEVGDAGGSAPRIEGGAPDACDDRCGRGRAVVHPVRGRRVGRHHGQATRHGLRRGQAGDVQDQARTHR